MSNQAQSHTPGPWKVSIYETPRNRTNPRQVTVVASGMTIRVSGFNQDANATLIAAAPEMLETLRMAEQLLHNILIGNSSRQEVDEKVPFITATIIKATCPELINETRSNS